MVLRLTRVGASVDLKDEDKGFPEGRLREQRTRDPLKGFFKGRGCWGLLQQLLATVGCCKEFKDEGLQGSVHSRVVRRLREIQGETSRFKLGILVQEMPSYIRGDPAHGPSSVRSRKAKADIKNKWSMR